MQTGRGSELWGKSQEAWSAHEREERREMGNCFEEIMTLKFPDLMKKIIHILKSSTNPKHRKENCAEARHSKLPQSSDEEDALEAAGGGKMSYPQRGRGKGAVGGVGFLLATAQVRDSRAAP